MPDQTLRTLRQLFGAHRAHKINASSRRHGGESGIPLGHPDYTGRTQNGQNWYVEEKSLARKTVTAEQEEYLDLAEKDGCFCAVVFKEVPGQVAWAYERFKLRGKSTLWRGDEAPYDWRANYAENLEEAKRVAKVRSGKR